MTFSIFGTAHTLSLVALGLVAIILGMLLAAFLITVKTVRRYSSEMANIYRMERNVQEWRDAIGKQRADTELMANGGEPDTVHEISTSDEVEYQPVIDSERLLEGVSITSLIGQRVEIIKNLKQFRIKIDVNVLQTLAFANESRHWIVKIPAFFASLAMLIGMLGTFWGLMMMVGDIGFQLSTINDAEFGNFINRLQGIRGVLAGVGTAFYTTIAGLLCTILATVMNFILEKQQLHLFEKLEVFTTNDLLPATLPSLEGDSMMEQISYRLQDSFDNMNGVIDRNNESLAQLNSVYASFSGIIREIRQITQREASHKLEGVILEMTNVNRNMKELINKYNNETILEEIQKLSRTNKKLLETYNNRLSDLGWLASTKKFMVAISIILGIISITIVAQMFIS